jgi:hypothetical protein
MIRGAKTRTLKTILQSFLKSFTNLGLVQFEFYKQNNWKVFYHSNFFKSFGLDSTTKNLTIASKNSIHFLSFFLDIFMEKGLPIFTFDVQKADKNLVKYSRGKSGKYSLT